MRPTFVMAVLCGAWGCSEPVTLPRTAAATERTDAETGVDPTPSAEAPVNDPQFHSRLRWIAKEYPSYGRVRTRDWVNGAIQPDVLGCRDFSDRDHLPVPRATFSDAPDPSGHTRKLYYLFVANPRGYQFPVPLYPSNPAEMAQAAQAQRAPVGQAIVKEAWIPQEADAELAKNPETEVARTQQLGVGPPTVVKTQEIAHARLNGKLYHAAQRASLFIMFKLEPDTPDTDQGWVYGTVNADGQTVTSAGMVTSCMNCHRRAPYDRQYGPKDHMY